MNVKSSIALVGLIALLFLSWTRADTIIIDGDMQDVTSVITSDPAPRPTLDTEDVTEIVTNAIAEHLADAPHGTSAMAVSKVYSPVDPLVIVATNQSQVIVALDKNLTVGPPNVSGISDGQTVRWRFTAVGANRTVYWPTNTTFKIPSSSAMVTNIVIVSGTTSIFGTEYVQATGKWLIEAYVYGY